MKISIIIPCYNSEKTIQRCLKSVIDQNYTKLEIICVDDGSNDKTPMIIKKQQKHNAKIKYYRSNTNNGPAHARNIGIKKATGDYVTFVDSDDIIEKDMILTMIRLLDKEGDIDFIRYNFKTTNKDRHNNVLNASDIKKINTKYNINFIINLFFIKKRRIPTYTPLLFINKRILSKIKFDENLRYMEDYDFYLNLIINSKKCAIVDEKKYCYLDNKKSITRNPDNDALKIKSMIALCEKINKTTTLSNYQKKNMTARIVRLMTSHIIVLLNQNPNKCMDILDKNQKDIKQIIQKSSKIKINPLKAVFLYIILSKKHYPKTITKLIAKRYTK